MTTEQAYLGDGVYASFDGYHVVIQTRSPGANTIFLDQTVWQALVDYGNSVLQHPVDATLYGNCSVCGEPIADDDFEVHSDYDGEDCHARCCPVCHEGDPAYEYTNETLDPLARIFMTGVPIDPDWNLELCKKPQSEADDEA